MYQNYVFQNFKQLDHYRLPSSAVPEYLHGRPPSVVKHCLIRKTKSNKYTQDAVKHAKTPGESYVIKDTKKHTLNFGTSNNSIVACSCKDWKKWHIPCKHFLLYSAGYQSGIGIVCHMNTETVPICPLIIQQLKSTWQCKEFVTSMNLSVMMQGFLLVSNFMVMMLVVVLFTMR